MGVCRLEFLPTFYGFYRSFHSSARNINQKYVTNVQTYTHFNFSSSPKRPDRLLSLISLTFKWYRGSFPGSKVAGAWSYLRQSVPCLWSPVRLHRVEGGKFIALSLPVAQDVFGDIPSGVTLVSPRNFPFIVIRTYWQRVIVTRNGRGCPPSKPLHRATIWGLWYSYKILGYRMCL